MNRWIGVALLSVSVVLASACGDNAEGELQTETDIVVVDGVEPSGDLVPLSFELENVGGQDATLVKARFVGDAEGGAGSFRFSGEEISPTIAAGDSATVELQFSPDADAPSGCDLLASSTVLITYLPTEESGFREIRVPIVVSGECSEKLRCGDILFSAEIIGESSTRTFQCFHLGGSDGAPVTVEQVGLESDDADPAFTFSSSPRLPVTLEPSDTLALELTFQPAGREQYASTLDVSTSGGDSYQFDVLGKGVGERPLCSDPDDSVPPPPGEVDNYKLELESQSIQQLEGTVIEIDAVNERYAGVLEDAVLIGTGSYLSEGCIATNDGASFQWRGSACQIGSGTLHNVITISADDVVEAQIGRLEASDTVRFEGYAIERIVDLSPGGGWWSDGSSSGEDVSNSAMFVTRVCDTGGSE